MLVQSYSCSNGNLLSHGVSKDLAQAETSGSARTSLRHLSLCRVRHRVGTAFSLFPYGNLVEFMQIWSLILTLPGCGTWNLPVVQFLHKLNRGHLKVCHGQTRCRRKQFLGSAHTLHLLALQPSHLDLLVYETNAEMWHYLNFGVPLKPSQNVVASMQNQPANNAQQTLTLQLINVTESNDLLLPSLPCTNWLLQSGTWWKPFMTIMTSSSYF